MGILLMNIVQFAMPAAAYLNPAAYGGLEGWNRIVWAINFAVADGKMRGLFAMLFGASMLLVANGAGVRDEDPASLHYRRMATLFLLGLIHAYLIWAGDILVLYSLCGAIVWIARGWPVRSLIAVALLLLGFTLAREVVDYLAVVQLRDAVERGSASPAASAAWQAYVAQALPSPRAVATDLAAYRGTYADALAARMRFAWGAHTRTLPQFVPETLAMMLAGMALLRAGLLSGSWRPRIYACIAAGGYAVALPLHIPLIRMVEASGFAPETVALAEAMQLTLLRPAVMLAHTSIVILMFRTGILHTFGIRVAAVGRTALTNYVGTSLVCTMIFNGYGLGWYGHLDRWQLYPVVLGVWLAILAWSKPWTDRFAYGPLEWLWRSLARGRPQEMRRTV